MLHEQCVTGYSQSEDDPRVLYRETLAREAVKLEESSRVQRHPRLSLQPAAREDVALWQSSCTTQLQAGACQMQRVICWLRVAG